MRSVKPWLILYGGCARREDEPATSDPSKADALVIYQKETSDTEKRDECQWTTSRLLCGG